MKRFALSKTVAIFSVFSFFIYTQNILGCSSCDTRKISSKKFGNKTKTVEKDKACSCNHPKPKPTKTDKVSEDKACSCGKPPRPKPTKTDKIETKHVSGTIVAEIPVGELFDKITILKIKEANITDSEKLENIKTELTSLKETKYANIPMTDELNALEQELLEINKKLWDIEDDIRDKERNKEFDREFIELARSVYYTNDERCKVKKAINMLVGSRLVEEKSYAAY